MYVQTYRNTRAYTHTWDVWPKKIQKSCPISHIPPSANCGFHPSHHYFILHTISEMPQKDTSDYTDEEYNAFPQIQFQKLRDPAGEQRGESRDEIQYSTSELCLSSPPPPPLSCSAVCFHSSIQPLGALALRMCFFLNYKPWNIQ